MATKKTSAASKSSSKATAVSAEAPDTSEGAPAEGARVKAPSLRIKTLVDRVAEATGGKKKGVKEMVEATLLALGEALAKGEDLNLPGLGRTRIARTSEKDGASLMTLKVRRAPHKKKDAKEPLADEEDDG